ncbi:MAG: GntR family transcriptional regulator [Candidatus Aminicenantes bacterium]|nr:GntR family transcriptional regulator [Candidatus Aminicenantes bacterium]
MTRKGILNLKSLKEQVYEYLSGQLEKGEIRPETTLNLDETSQKLGVSRTPLRDALLQLEMEGFVSILPRRGVIVNHLTLQDIRSYYEIIGALESTALLAAFEKMSRSQIKRMYDLNSEMEKAIEQDNFNQYYQKNLKFHNIFLDLCGNPNLVKIVNTLKRRLYDFPRQEGFVKQWEQASIREHKEFVRLIEDGKKEETANYIRDVHWSFEVQEKFLKRYYKKAVAASEKKDG